MTEEKKMTDDKKAKEQEEPATDEELAEEIRALNKSVEYWDMAQTHSCIFPF